MLSQQKLDRSSTWYTTQGLANGMIDRVAIGMESYGWEKLLARDVLMNICQRRCQNSRRRDNKERRQAGEEIKRGRPKAVRLADYDNPMDFISTMKALPEHAPVMPQPALTQPKPTPPELAAQPKRLPEVVNAVKRHRAKMGLVPSGPTSQANKKRKYQEEPESSRRRHTLPSADIQAPLRSGSRPPLFPSTPLNSSASYRAVVNGQLTILSKKLAYPEFFRAIIDAAQSRAISLPSGTLSAWYQTNTVHGHVITDDEACYTIFLKRISSEQVREEEGGNSRRNVPLEGNSRR